MATPHGPAPAPPALVGRERELCILRETLAAAFAGRGSLVLIGGEAGIGKTTLAEVLLAEASAQGALVLVGRSYDLSETPPYGPWAEALARAPRGDGLPVPPDLTGGALASQEAIFAAVRDHLAALATARPLVLLLDDLHWADSASLDLLRVLGRGLADAPLLVLATYRADEVADDHPLAVLLPLLVREARAARLDLRPLDRDAVALFVTGRYALVPAEVVRLTDYLAARSEGNALFLGELLRTLEGERLLREDGAGWVVGDLAATPVPALLRQVIAGRVARLDPETQRLLAVAAVIGQEVPLAVWATAADMPEDALLDHAERALATRLLAGTPDGTGVRFAHALLREALYDGIPPFRRRVAHRRVADALAATASPEPDAVAYHLRQAGDPRAAAWLVRAGQRAARAFAYATAAARFSAALATSPEVPATAVERGWLHLRLALVLRHGDRGPYLAAADEAVRLATETREPALLAHARFARAHLRAMAGRLREGIAEMAALAAELDGLPAAERAALVAAGESVLHAAGLPYTPDEVTVCAHLLDWHSAVGDFAAAGALAPRLVPALAALAAGRAGPGAATAAAKGLASLYEARGKPEDAWVAYQRASEANRAAGNLHQVAVIAREMLEGVALPYYADQAALRRQLLTAAAAATRAYGGAVLPLLLGGRASGLALLLEGRWDELAALAAGHRSAVAPGRVARYRGDASVAWDVVRRGLPEGPGTVPGDTFFLLARQLQRLAAELALDVGDLPLAHAWLAAHDRWHAWSGAILGRAEGQLGWAEYHRAAGDPAAARPCAEAALAHATEPRQPLALLAARRLLGELDTAAGRHQEANAHLEAALALAEACAAPYERALTLLALAELRIAAGKPSAATDALEAARGLLVPLEAAPALGRADALAARLAAIRLPPPAALPFGLTVREAAVLRLVAEGLPDAQIAARLFVTRNTVNFHLKAVYGKLGVNTRAAAGRLAVAHGLA